jgi:hypothetical protein
MHARMTRYEGATPETIEDSLQAKKGVLPTEFGQTEDMKGAIFLTDRTNCCVIVISIWEDEAALQASEEDATRVREEATGEGESSSVEHYEVSLLAVEQAGEIR